MDAKPYRPTRPLPFRDENAVPTVNLKTLHQRNKSSPALSTLAKNTAGKPVTVIPGQRRAAFADLSNTSRFGVKLSKDDAHLSGKGVVLEPVKEDKEVHGQLKHNTSFLRPAQRPLSVSGIKNFLNNLTSTSSSGDHTKVEQRSDAQESIHSQFNFAQPVPRKALSKKSTMVFRENEIPCLAEAPSAPPETAESEVAPVQSQLSTVPDVPPLDSHMIQLPSIPLIDLSASVNSTFFDAPSEGVKLPVESSVADLISEDLANSHIGSGQEPNSDSSEQFEDALDQPVSELPSLSSNSVIAQSVIPVDPALLDLHANIQPAVAPVKPEVVDLKAAGVPLNLSKPSLQSSEKSEGYDNYEEDAYDEEGYYTVGDYSLHSKGGFTTNATTVILAPGRTVKDEEEIFAAHAAVADIKELIEMEEDEAWDISMVTEYGDEIFGYMHKLEEQMRPNPYYMENQTEIQWSMRSILMDWLVQVHHRFSLLPETLFLCVNYIDRFLSCKVVSLGKLQLVGATAIFVAAKYEEINCPSIQEIVYMVDGGYTVEEIIKAERFMLTMLQFELGWPGPMSFLRRVSKADDYDLDTRTLAKYFLELTIMDERFVGCIPSYTAAGAHCLARLMLQKGGWSPRHVHFSDYTFSQLKPLMLAMLSCCEDPHKHHAAIYDKYTDKRYKSASKFVQAELNKGFKLPRYSSSNTLGMRFEGMLLNSTAF